jgi:hypothetical protein
VIAYVDERAPHISLASLALSPWLHFDPPDPQVDLPKPLGLRFARGNDGGAYVVANDPKLGNTDPRIEVPVPGGLPASSAQGVLLCGPSPAWLTTAVCWPPQHGLPAAAAACVDVVEGTEKPAGAAA